MESKLLKCQYDRVTSLFTFHCLKDNKQGEVEPSDRGNWGGFPWMSSIWVPPAPYLGTLFHHRGADLHTVMYGRIKLSSGLSQCSLKSLQKLNLYPVTGHQKVGCYGDRTLSGTALVVRKQTLQGRSYSLLICCAKHLRKTLPALTQKTHPVLTEPVGLGAADRKYSDAGMVTARCCS